MLHLSTFAYRSLVKTTPPVAVLPHIFFKCLFTLSAIHPQPARLREATTESEILITQNNLHRNTHRALWSNLTYNLKCQHIIATFLRTPDTPSFSNPLTTSVYLHSLSSFREPSCTFLVIRINSSIRLFNPDSKSPRIKQLI